MLGRIPSLCLPLEWGYWRCASAALGGLTQAASRPAGRAVVRGAGGDVAGAGVGGAAAGRGGVGLGLGGQLRRVPGLQRVPVPPRTPPGDAARVPPAHDGPCAQPRVHQVSGEEFDDAGHGRGRTGVSTWESDTPHPRAGAAARSRDLVWHEVSELVLAVLPALQVQAARAQVRVPWAAIQSPAGEQGRLTRDGAARRTELSSPRQGRASALLRQAARFDSPGPSAAGGPGAAGEEAGRGEGEAGYDPAATACAVCRACPIQVPFAAKPCGHVYCFACLHAETELDPRWHCLRCGARVEAIARPGPAGVAAPTG